MVTRIFSTIAERATALDEEAEEITDAKRWYKSEISKIRRDERVISPKNVRGFISAANIGQMFMFLYDPKHKETLPIYDRFPLVFPIKFYSDGFLGINMHYLSRGQRASLMDALYMTINNRKNDETTRLRISYEVLNGSIRMRNFKPCVKRYLSAHVVQNFIYIEPKHWDKALMLPTERFVEKNVTSSRSR